MTTVIASKLDVTSQANNLSHVFDSMAELNQHSLQNISWPEYTTTATASFSIAHLSDEVLIYFKSEEQYLSVSTREINGPVHRDNCVEFFVAFPDRDEYYNLEFNCLGVGKIGFGESRNNRTMLNEMAIKGVKTMVKLSYDNTQTNSLRWELLLAIPKATFSFNTIESFDGMCIKANIHKCGDNLPDPHYLTWSQIKTADPDFHQPTFFAKFHLAEI